MQPRLSNKTLD